MAVQPVEISCSSCGASTLVEPFQRTSRCPYCDSPAVVDRPATPDRPDPVFALGFTIDRQEAVRRLRHWLSQRRWAPASLRRAAAERVQGMYLPAYLYTAVADSSYRAIIGEHYWDTEYDARRKRTRRVRKTEHHLLQGSHGCYLADIVVTASRGIPNRELEAVEPFDLEALRRYTPALVAGWMSEEPSLTRDECLELAREEGRGAVRKLLRRFMPGDTHRDLESSTELRSESLELTLLPVWVFAVRHDPGKPPIRVLLNGQTGAVCGRTPLSWPKILGVAAAAAVVIALTVLVLGALS